MKCFCDTIILDDFKTALDRLRVSALSRSQRPRQDTGGILSPDDTAFRSFGTNKNATVDIEKGEYDAELESRGSDPNSIYVSRSVTVAGSGK